jgi:hypothetical protein
MHEGCGDASGDGEAEAGASSSEHGDVIRRAIAPGPRLIGQGSFDWRRVRQKIEPATEQLRPM